MCVPSFILIGCCVSELHGHLCAYRNVWPEAAYCCFTRTTLFTIRVRGCYHITKFCYLLVSEIAKCIAWRLFNPRRACAARVTVLGLCVCVSVTQHLTFHVIIRVKNDNNLLSGG